MKQKIIKVDFEGIDFFNRPIFKDIKSKNRYGDVNNLFSSFATKKRSIGDYRFKRFVIFWDLFWM